MLYVFIMRDTIEADIPKRINKSRHSEHSEESSTTRRCLDSSLCSEWRVNAFSINLVFI